jgi:hypothetical protein
MSPYLSRFISFVLKLDVLYIVAFGPAVFFGAYVAGLIASSSVTPPLELQIDLVLPAVNLV